MKQKSYPLDYYVWLNEPRNVN